MLSSFELCKTWYYRYPYYIFSAQFISQLNYFPLHPISYQASLSNVCTYISLKTYFFVCCNFSTHTHIYIALYVTNQHCTVRISPCLHSYWGLWLSVSLTLFIPPQLKTLFEDSLLYLQYSTTGFISEPDYSHQHHVIHLKCIKNSFSDGKKNVYIRAYLERQRQYFTSKPQSSSRTLVCLLPLLVAEFLSALWYVLLQTAYNLLCQVLLWKCCDTADSGTPHYLLFLRYQQFSSFSHIRLFVRF